MKKQFLAKILVVCMVLSMLSVAAFAADESPWKAPTDEGGTHILNQDSQTAENLVVLPESIAAGTYTVAKDVKVGTTVLANGAKLTISGKVYAVGPDTNIATFQVSGIDSTLNLAGGAAADNYVYITTSDTSATLVLSGTLTNVSLRNASSSTAVAVDAAAGTWKYANGAWTTDGGSNPSPGVGGGGGGGGSTTTPSGNDTVTVNNNASADVANLGDNPTVVVTGKEDDTKFEASLVNGANKDTITVETPAGTVTVLDPSKVDKVTTEVGTDASGDTTYTVSVTKNGAAANTTITYAVPTGNTAAGNNLVVKKVNADGTETILPKSALDGSMMKVLLDGGATIKVVDNTKTFSDVSGHWAKDAIAFVTSRELFLGTSATNFSANAPMTRGMLVTVLHRLEGLPSGGSASFSDVASGEYYADAVAWASANGIVEGYANGTFRPSTRITREQLAVMLYRYVQKIGAASKGQTGSYAGFADSSSVSSWATDAMSWAVGSGILQGTGSNLNPGGNATRGEVATMLMRFVNLITK